MPIQAIWKFPIQIVDEQHLKVPAPATPLHTGLDPQGDPCIWFIVDPDADRLQVDVHVHGTGHPLVWPISTASNHVGTFQQGQFIWHAFAMVH